MEHIEYLQPNGRIVAVKTAPGLQQVASRDGNPIVKLSELAGVDGSDLKAEDLLDGFYIVEGGGEVSLTARPSVPDLPAAAIVGFVLDWAQFAAGTVITVNRQNGDPIVCDDPADPMEFEDAGSYYLWVDAPFPAHSFSHVLEIANA